MHEDHGEMGIKEVGISMVVRHFSVLKERVGARRVRRERSLGDRGIVPVNRYLSGRSAFKQVGAEDICSVGTERAWFGR